MGQIARLAANQGPRGRRESSARMCRGVWRIEGGICDALRLLRRKLAAPENRSDRVDALAREVSERENAGAAREKCATAGHRAIDRSAGRLSAATAQIDRSPREERRIDLNSGVELRGTARNHRR